MNGRLVDVVSELAPSVVVLVAGAVVLGVTWLQERRRR